MANFDKVLLKLFVDEPFYAGIMLSVNRFSSREIPTAGVSFNEKTGRYNLIYNPDFINGMKTEEAVAIFIHEMLHIVLKHVTDRSAPMKDVGLKAWNFATDLAINSHLIGKLPKVTIDQDGKEKEWEFIIPGEGVFKNYPPFMSAEYYLRAIMDDPNIKKFYVNGDGTGIGDMVGDHSGWGGTETSRNVDGSALERSEIERIIRRGQKQAAMQGWGTVPQEMQKYINELLQPKVDWKSVLRYFVNGSQRADKFSSFKKVNKRYPYQHPGRRTHRTAKIAIAIDQSGSVSDFLLAKFFNELNSLALMATFTVVPFDWIVHEDKVFEWKKGTKKPWERVAHGGTNFNAPTEYVNNNREFDALIILTDMGAEKPVACTKPRLWITEKSYQEFIKPVAGNDMALVID